MKRPYIHRPLNNTLLQGCERKNFGLVHSLLILNISSAMPADARDYFNPAALELTSDAQSTLNLEQFSVDGGQLPGSYRVDIYLNNNWVDMRDVSFVEANGRLSPQLTPIQLRDMGVKLAAFPLLQQLPSDKPLSDLEQYIPQADSRFDFGQQRLYLSIPQAALISEARGYVDPAEWDQGLPAALVNYNFSGANTHHNSSGNEESYYLNLRSGANLGSWRLRNYSTYNDSNGMQHWDSVNTYLQRDIQTLKGQLTLGDGATPGDVFDSVQYRGAQLASDDNMFPDSLKGFAPVVRGIAQSNAQVTVRQNGYIIYQTYVPPGAFAITDLYPTSSSGDLEVTITEANGTERLFLQPFSAVPVMLREGRLKYAVTTGEYRSANRNSLTPTFGQGTFIFGLPHDTTVYGGILTSDHYNAQILGGGYSLGIFGSLSMDVTQAKTRLRGDSSNTGQSYRFQYAKDVEATNTTFTLAGYRYSTSGFYDFQEANELGSYSNAWHQTYNKRSKAQLNINQSLRDYGNFYVSAYQQDYWGEASYERNLSASYNLSLNGITYGVTYTYSKTSGNQSNDQQLAFNMQVPLSKWPPNSWINYSMNTGRRGSTSQQAGLSGTMLAGNNLNYNLQQSYANQGAGTSGSANVGYKGTYGEIQGGYNYNHDSRQINYSLQGGIMVHPYGVTLSQSQGDTLVLVRAPGAKGVTVQNNTGLQTDSRGYAVVPFVSTYRKNRIALDTETLADGVDIDTNIKTVIPTLGAVVLADFKTRLGSRVLMTLSYKGKPIPFGATATVLQDKNNMINNGIVGPGGQLYLSGMPESGKLNIRWGNASDQQCQVVFTLPAAISNTELLELETRCL